MQSTNEKTMFQYCSVCKEHFDMEIVQKGSSKSAIWLKCPSCKGFLPHMLDDEDGTDPAQRSKNGRGDAIALEDIDVDNAREYSDKDEYEIGDVIHHRSWNDFGKVIAKDHLPGNRKTIWAQFLRQGKVQLLEGVK